MARRFLAHEDLFDWAAPPYATGERRLVAMPLHIPYPMQFLVTMDPHTHEPRVTTTTLGPLSWRPYTMLGHVPLSDTVTIAHLKNEGECVMAMPTRDQVRQAWIMSHPMPNGICSADVARLTLVPSKLIAVPSIQECPLNFECIIEYYQECHGYGMVSLRVMGATLDDEILPLSREEVTSRYPVNYVGERAFSDGTVQPIMAMMGAITPCPTFPVGHKEGWDTRMRSWLKDLADEGYISSYERDAVMAWVEEYEMLRLDPYLERRRFLQTLLTRFAELAAWQEWEALHAFIKAESGERG